MTTKLGVRETVRAIWRKGHCGGTPIRAHLTAKSSKRPKGLHRAYSLSCALYLYLPFRS